MAGVPDWQLHVDAPSTQTSPIVHKSLSLQEIASPVNEHSPLPLSHSSLVQLLPSLQIFLVPPTQMPLTQ